MVTEMNRTEVINAVFNLRSEGLSYKEIDNELMADKGLLKGCTYRDFSYRVTKTADYQNMLKNAKQPVDIKAFLAPVLFAA